MQVERLVRVHASPYQRGLTAVLQQQLTATGLKGVRISNAMMELRSIANHPLIRSALALLSSCNREHHLKFMLNNTTCHVAKTVCTCGYTPQ